MSPPAGSFAVSFAAIAFGSRRRVQPVGAWRVEPVDGKHGMRVVKRDDMRVACDLHCCGGAGEGRAEVEPVHLQMIDGDGHRQVEATSLGRRGWLGVRVRDGKAWHRDVAHGQVLHRSRLADQRERRPVERHVVDAEPRALGVAQFGMGQAKRVREAAGQPGEHDLAAGEACRLVLDEASAGADIGDDQDEGDQSHRQQKHHAEHPPAPRGEAGAVWPGSPACCSSRQLPQTLVAH